MQARLCALGAILPLLLVPACSSNDRSRLTGHWESIDANESVNLDLGASGGLLIWVPPNTTITGRYVLLAGDHVDFELSTAWNGLSKHREQVTLVGNELILRDRDGTTLRFRRSAR